MQAELISIGTELLLGEITNTNAPLIAQALRSIGLDLVYMTTIGDNEKRIAQVIVNALNRVDLVITTGGLGPTVDDVTREAIAKATDRPLVFRQDLLEQIEEKFRHLGVKMSKNNQRQAYVPQGAQPIENPVGTAPIFVLETERGIVTALPGVPREMGYLLQHELIPRLRTYLAAPAVITSLTLRTAGIGESQIDAQIGDLMTANNPTVGLTAHAGQTDIRITAKASIEEAAKALIAPIEQEVRKRLGDFVYGTGTDLLEDEVFKLLKDRQESIASIELGTDELLSKRLQTASRIYPPGLKNTAVLASTDCTASSKVDDEICSVAEEAALAMCQRYLATYGLAVIIQPKAESLIPRETIVHAAMAIATEKDRRSRRFSWTSARSDAPTWATTHAMALLRRVILAQTKGQ